MDEIIFDDGTRFKLERYNYFKFFEENLGNLDIDRKNKFNFIYSEAMVHSNIRMGELLDQYNLRRNFALPKYRNYKDFVSDELFKASIELTQVQLNCEWEEIDSQLDNIIVQYRKLRKKGWWLPGRKDDLKTNFYGLIILAGLFEDYMNMDIDYITKSIDYKTLNLRDFDKIIDFFARFKWVVFLKGMIETGEYNKKAEIMKDLPSLPECFLDQKYFYTILENPQISDLYSKHIDGTYHLKKGKKVHLAGLAHRLLNTGKLNTAILRNSQDLARVFCPFFHVQFNVKEEKQFQADRAKTDSFNFIK